MIMLIKKALIEKLTIKALYSLFTFRLEITSSTSSSPGIRFAIAYFKTKAK